MKEIIMTVSVSMVRDKDIDEVIEECAPIFRSMETKYIERMYDQYFKIFNRRKHLTEKIEAINKRVAELEVEIEAETDKLKRRSLVGLKCAERKKYSHDISVLKHTPGPVEIVTDFNRTIVLIDDNYQKVLQVKAGRSPHYPNRVYTEDELDIPMFG